MLRRLILERERWFGSFIHGGIGGRITFVLWAGSSNRLHPKLPSQHACCASMKRSESWNVCFFKAWDSTRVNSSLRVGDKLSTPKAAGELALTLRNGFSAERHLDPLKHLY
jgi:hypothetical protein